MSADRRKAASTGASLFVGVFTRNVTTKIAAFILAVLVWFTVRMELTVDKEDTIPLQLDLEASLMLAGDLPPEVTVKLEGPPPDIALYEKSKPPLVLRILPSDLRGQLSAELEFGHENDDTERFSLGIDSDIRIKQVYVEGPQGPAPVRVRIAVKKDAVVTVRQPTVENLPAEWEERIELLTPTVRVVGPAEWFTRNQEVSTVSIGATGILAGREELDEVTISERTLALDPGFAAEYVSLAAGERIRYQGSFRKTKAPEDLRVPFRVVLFEQPVHPYLLEPVPNSILKKEDGGYSLVLTFRGTPSDLGKLKQAIAEKTVYAYVLAEDFGPYREGSVEEARGFVQPVRVEIHSDIFTNLAARVSFDQPSEDVELEMKQR